MLGTRQFLLQSHTNLGHFWCLVFSYVTKTADDAYYDVSITFIFDIIYKPVFC